ncbi:hypothetical protein NFI96_033386, partial [Prochilodus magdalenae]
EVPQASSGFAPFELLFGREVRGPLDVLKKAWEGNNPTEKLNFLSFVLKMRDKMADLSAMVHENMKAAQAKQKVWYDKAEKALVPACLIPDLKNEVKAKLEIDVIEPSSSEWCSPVVLVPKKDGGLRFCVNFSKLNAVSTFDPYPMPRADELIERLGLRGSFSHHP